MLSDRWTYRPILNRHGSENYSVRAGILLNVRKDRLTNLLPKRRHGRSTLGWLTPKIYSPKNSLSRLSRVHDRHDDDCNDRERDRTSPNALGANDHKKTRHEGDGNNIPERHALQTQSKLRF